MRFWDASAIVPLCVEQHSSDAMRALLRQDSGVVVWWVSLIECRSGFGRLRREGMADLAGEGAARAVLRTHTLRASDARQLAATLVWAGSPPASQFVSLDQHLREAARLEGLTPLPA